MSHKYGFFIIHCVVSPVRVKHPLDLQNKNNTCCSIIIGVLPLEIARSFVTVPGKRDHLGNFFKIELLIQQERVGFELQNALHI